MLGPLAALPLLFFAQAVAPVAGGPESATNQFLQLVPFLAVIPIFYLLLYRPQQQQEKKRRQMIDKIKRNDKVLTAAGMYGTVMSVDAENDKVLLRLDDDGKVKITFTRASIVRVMGEPTEKSAEAK